MASGLDVQASLVLTWPGGHELQLAAAGSYLILNVPSQQVLDLITAGPPGGAKEPKKPKAERADPLQVIHDLARALGLVLDLRVGGKTYVTFGLPDRRSPKITLSAVLGKIGSFFS